VIARRCLIAAGVVWVAVPALAQDIVPFSDDPATDSFVASNLIAIFYHELGHALIDTLRLPVLGREEDAADTLSSLLIEQLWDEADSIGLIYDVALGYDLYAREAGTDAAALAYDDTHSLDQQRYYNYVCLYYGANPEGREDIAQELNLPPDRAAGCEDEWALVSQSWETLLVDVPFGGGAPGLVLADPDATDAISALLRGEIAILNDNYALPVQIAVTVEPCGEPNAFYHADSRTITLCTEFATDLLRLYATVE
jgi:hypothetical protein